jgi:hypothetical protein
LGSEPVAANAPPAPTKITAAEASTTIGRSGEWRLEDKGFSGAVAELAATGANAARN